MKRAKGAHAASGSVSSRIFPKLLNPRVLIPKSPISAVRAVWLLAILWYEVGTFQWSLAGCRWPDAELVPRDTEDNHASTSHPTHVLLIADPQVRAPHRQPVWRRWLHLTDLSLRKRWSYICRTVQPDVVVFLGDMLDNGRYAEDDEYREAFEYFRSIFRTEPEAAIYYVPGNHDVGLGPSNRVAGTHARRRFQKYFGPPNGKVSIANHTLVMLDASGLVDEDYRRAATSTPFEDWKAMPGGTVEFINDFAGVGSEEPVILFSHIPLFRPDTAGCGPLREKGAIRRGVGPGFQNMLMRDTTNYILRYVRPAAIFSGNDHDYCEYTHSIPLLPEGPEPKIDYVREVTVKGISSAEDIRKPGFQLLSLAPFDASVASSNSFADVPCFFPDEQTVYWGRYIPLLVFSLIVLFVSAMRRHSSKRQPSDDYQPLSAEDVELDRGMDTVLPLSANSHDGTSPRSPEPTSLFSTARTTPGTSSLAPTFRATGQHTPGTPDFTVDGGEPSRLLSPGLQSPSPSRVPGPHARLRSIGESEDVEGDEEDFQTPGQMARYRLRSDKGDDYFRLTLDRARRRRRFAWTWTFELGGRRRRLIVGVPYLLEHVCRTFWGALSGYWRGSNSTQESVAETFVAGVLAAAWPPILLFCIVCYFSLR